MEDMTDREQLIHELEIAPDELVQSVLGFLNQVKTARPLHPLSKFVGILNDAEATALKDSIAAEFRQVDRNEW